VDTVCPADVRAHATRIGCVRCAIVHIMNGMTIEQVNFLYDAYNNRTRWHTWLRPLPVLSKLCDHKYALAGAQLRLAAQKQEHRLCVRFDMHYIE
jgi:hypothetical protein